MPQRILLLLTTETYRARDFLEAARRMGVELVVGTDQANVTASLAPEGTLSLDFRDRERGTGDIAAYHARRPLDAIVAAEDEGTHLAAQASQVLGLPGHPVESTLSARNKRVFREIVAAAGLEGPWFVAFPSDEDPERAAALVRYPCVLKPTFLNASRGVIRADDREGFVRAFERIRALLADPDVQAQGGEAAREILVESYLPGAEVALEGLVQDGRFRPLAFFDKPEPLEGPYFEETLFVTPSRHPEALQAEALRVADEAVRALGLRHGAVHAELRLHEGRAVLLEIAPRSIGGHCSRTLRFGTGMSLEELILRQALGAVPSDSEREAAAAGVMMIPIPAAGRLHAVHGLVEARAVPGILEVEIAIPLTQPVVPLPEGHRYLGFIFARADTPDAVEAALRESHRRLGFDIRPEP